MAVDFTTIDGFLGWFLNGFDTALFGQVGMVSVIILAGVFLLLTFFNANKYTAMGFMACTLLALGMYGYSIVGWLAPMGALVAGLLLGLAMVRLFNL